MAAAAAPILIMKFLRLSLAIAVVALLFVAGRRMVAAQSITVQLGFQMVRQGQVGIVTISDIHLIAADVVVLGRSYLCFPLAQGAGCFVAVPMEQPIKDYPLVVNGLEAGGIPVVWNGTFRVASGVFIDEMLSLPANLTYLLQNDVEANEDERLKQAYSLITPERYWEGQFVQPIKGDLTSPFGAFRLYNGTIPNRHTGQDIHAATGTPVLAAASGQVVLSRLMDIHGNNIIIDHGWSVYSEYAHLSVRYVVSGQFVLQGQVIGLSGSSGRSTGPHFHWEVAVDGIQVNPTAFIQLTLPK